MPAAPQYKPPGWLIVAVLAAILISLAWLGSRPPESGANPVVEIGYSEFRSLLAGKSIAEVTFHGRELAGRLKQQAPLGTAQRPTDRFTVRLPDVASPDLLKELEAAGIDIKVAPDDTGPSFRNIFWALVPWLVLFGLYWWIWRRSMGNMAGGLGPRGGVGQFLEGRAREEDKGEIEVTFEDVAGQDNAKREVSELVDFLKDPERYMKLGATVPHGVLLIGPPGTGKTLLARALAGEAGVPFFSISASEFIEVFVGVGASRVRHMFDEAKKRAPAIIFIDELDSIGRVRGTGLGGGHDEREQTLNQILSELDGFTRHEAVIVIAATNRPDVLDPALLRPGRFDRHVTLELPDQKARRKILDVHVRNVPLAANVDLDTVASGTPGFSGADLKNLVNEAAMAAARDNGAEVTAQHFDAARDRIIMGAVRSLVIEPEEQRRLAIHESGHTVVAHYLPHSDPIYKVTVIPRGQALGATHQLPEEERYTLPDVYLKERLAVMLAGRAAEKIFLDSVSSGADDDIKQATALARAMVTRWGMSDEVGPVDVRQSEEHPFLGREIAQPRHFSERTAEAVDKAVHELLTAAEAQAAEVITEHRAAMEELMAALVERETLERDEITAILGPPHGLAAAAPSAAAE